MGRVRAFVKFTDTDGGDVWVAPRWVTRVRTPLPGRYDEDARTMISMGNTDQAVKEDLETVLQILDDNS